MIKAVVFDCFGVLTSDGWLPFRDTYFGDDPELLERAKHLNKSVDAGKLPYRSFIALVADMARMSATEAQAAIESNTPNAALFDYIASELQGNYKLGMLSNAAANWLDELFVPEQVALFDAVALSYETGVIKPDARAYQTIAQKLGVAAEECVFIDDQPAYCEGATAAGMTAIVYRSNDQAVGALSELLGTNT